MFQLNFRTKVTYYILYFIYVHELLRELASDRQKKQLGRPLEKKENKKVDPKQRRIDLFFECKLGNKNKIAEDKK